MKKALKIIFESRGGRRVIMIIKYIGFVLIGAAAFVFSREYARTLKKRLSEYEEFLRFMEHIRRSVAESLAPPSEWLAGFSSELLDELGFCEAYKGTGSMSMAFSEISGKTRLDVSSRDLLSGFFSSLGATDSNDELAMIDKVIEGLAAERDKLSSDVPKNIKIAAVLAAAFAIGIIILFS